MILIADAGATSIDWRLINESGSISQATTKGFNPYQQNADFLQSCVEDLLQQLTIDPLKALHYYGAGISSKENYDMVLQVLTRNIPASAYHIEHDLLAAARALLLDQPGIACILGTGTNSCYYDGKEIRKVIPSLGFALGDEGSGASLGKRLVVAYLRGDMPEDLVGYFKKRFNLTEAELLHQIYQGETPAKYLASFSKFLMHHQKHPFIYQLIYQEFKRFFENILMKYDDLDQLNISFNGSIAFYYTNILRQVGNDLNLSIRNIVESPIAGLTLYHQRLQQ